MSLTVTQRPPAYSPVNNPVVYKFTVTGGPFTLYRVDVGVYYAGINVLIGTLSKSPDLSGDVLVDVSAVLKTIVYRDWDITTEDENNIGAFDFYIKYQEFYTGSATSPVDDVGNPKTTVIASLQIGSAADLSDYVLGGDTKKILTKFDKMSMWRGYPFSLSVINDQSGYSTRVREYDASNTLISEYGTSLLQSNLVRTFITEPEADTKKILFNVVSGVVLIIDSSTWTEPSPFSGDQNFDSKTGNEFVVGTMTPFAEYSAEQAAVIPIGITPAGINVDITIATAAGATIIVQFILLDNAHGNTGSFVQKSYTYPDTGTISEVLNFPELTVAAEYLAIVATQTGPGGLNSVTINLPVNQVLAFVSPTERSETKEITVKDPCENPVYLFWKNTLGGDSFWMFDFNQEYSWETNDVRKAKQLLLFESNVSMDEFNAINEVNTPGIVYTPAIQELTTSVDKNMARTDQQLYVIDTDGAKVGVINVTRSQGTNTRKLKHNAEVVIEYPYLFL